jgi:hypothetical protein
MYRAVGVFAALVLMAGCGAQSPSASSGAVPSPPMRRPAAAPATAFVSYHNMTDHYAKLYVEWSYAGSPIWQVEHTECVAPKQLWKTSVLYNKPDSGPQIRMYARVMDNSACSGLFSKATRFVSFGDLKFTNHQVAFTAEIFHEPRFDFVLCARGNGFPAKCDAIDGYPPAPKKHSQERLSTSYRT